MREEGIKEEEEEREEKKKEREEKKKEREEKRRNGFIGEKEGTKEKAKNE